MTELQPVIHFCYVILFNNFARPLRLIKAMQSQMVLTCFIFWPNQLNWVPLKAKWALLVTEIDFAILTL